MFLRKKMRRQTTITTKQKSPHKILPNNIEYF